MLQNKNTKEALINLKVIAKKTVMDRNVQETVFEITKNRVPLGKAEDLINKSDEVESHFTEAEIYWLMKAYNKATGSSDLDVSKHFSDIEISEYEQYYLPKDESYNTVVLNNVKQVADGMFHCYKCDYETIKRSQSNGIVKYNYSTQREAKVLAKGGVEILEATVIRKNVEGIAESMLRNDFTPNTITWNILKTGTEVIQYDSEKETLTITTDKNTIANIIDGYHRTLAIEKIVDANKVEDIINPFMFITILNYTVLQAQNYIKQEQMGTKLTKNQQKLFTNDNSMMVAKEINTMGTNENNSIRGKLASIELQALKSNTKIATINSVAETIKEYYGDVLTGARDVSMVSNWLVEFMNEVTGIFAKDFENIGKSRKTSVVTYNNMICTFIGISRKFYIGRKRMERWQEMIEEMFEAVDFSIVTNSEWRDTLIISERTNKEKIISKSIRNKVVEMFKNCHIELV